MSGQLVLTSFAFVVVIVAMYWGAAIARRKLGIGAHTVAPGALKVVGKRPLEPNKALYVVKIADRYVLVGSAEGSINLIDHITADEFSQMTDVEEAKPAKARKAVAAAAPDDDTSAEDAPAPAGQFMSVTESFGYFLGKARGSRDASARVAAQAAAADETEDEDLHRAS
jgi:flagellar biogenesis protein FliO